jgi:hypothetical protein
VTVGTPRIAGRVPTAALRYPVDPVGPQPMALVGDAADVSLRVRKIGPNRR